METKTIMATATDGTKVTFVVPTTLPTNDRAEYLRKLWRDHVKLLEGHWKGKVQAVVPKALGDDMAEAMEFMGALVDYRHDGNIETVLASKGYWAHGFDG